MMILQCFWGCFLLGLDRDCRGFDERLLLVLSCWDTFLLTAFILEVFIFVRCRLLAALADAQLGSIVGCLIWAYWSLLFDTVHGWLFMLICYCCCRGDFIVHNLEICAALSFICHNGLTLRVFIIRLLLFEVVLERGQCWWLSSLGACIDHLHYVDTLC